MPTCTPVSITTGRRPRTSCCSSFIFFPVWDFLLCSLSTGGIGIFLTVLCTSRQAPAISSASKVLLPILWCSSSLIKCLWCNRVWCHGSKSIKCMLWYESTIREKSNKQGAFFTGTPQKDKVWKTLVRWIYVDVDRPSYTWPSQDQFFVPGGTSEKHAVWSTCTYMESKSWILSLCWGNIHFQI